MPTQKCLRELFDYNPETGELTRRATGKVYDTFDKDGYVLVRIGFQAHRVIWEMHNGPIPPGFQIDHIDRNPSNNKLSNLRVVTPFENAQNRSYPATSLASSGIVGVYRRGRKWAARIYVGRHSVFLGTYETQDEAVLARQTAEAFYRKRVVQLEAA